jgi:hypothetical protein
VVPDGLEQAFRRRIIFVAQDISHAKARTPVGVKIIRRRKHCGLLLRLRLSKVKLASKILNAANGGFAGLWKLARFFAAEFIGRKRHFLTKLRIEPR